MQEKREWESLFFSPVNYFPSQGWVKKYHIKFVCYSSKTFMQIMFVLPWVSRRIFHQDGWLFRPGRFRLSLYFFSFLSFNLKAKVLPSLALWLPSEGELALISTHPHPT